jgi:two-component system nitrogen regulation response regulator GlnG
VLIVDDEPIIGYSLRRMLEEEGVQTHLAQTGAEGLRRYHALEPDVVVLDYQLPDTTGLEVFRAIQAADPRTPVILITAFGTTDLAIEAMRLGAFDYLIKPLDYDRIKGLLKRAFEAARLMGPASLLPGADNGDRIVGRSAVMQEMCKLIGRVAPTDATVLIMGESGVGKELVARAVYQNSRRSAQRFLAINCAALPESLLESELFGHEKGAFTGADRRRIGKFEQCNGGTLFLDEIGDMPAVLQAKMLRVLQDQRFERLGSADTVHTDVRLIAATNADLARKVDEGQFRVDLYYRLRVVTIRVPPLRERREDIPELASTFLFRFNAQLRTQLSGFHPDALALLVQHSWPGNVRELQSAVKEAMVRSAGRLVMPADLETVLRGGPGQGPVTAGPAPAPLSQQPQAELQSVEAMVADLLAQGETGIYHKVLEHVERLVLARVLESSGGRQVLASDLLGINRTTLRKRLRELGMSVGRVVVDEHE